MAYLVYLLGMLALCGVTVTFSRGIISMGYLMNYLDYGLLAMLLLVCILALSCTKLLIPFIQAFPFVLLKRELSAAQCRQSLLAVKTATTATIAFSVLYMLVQCSNLLFSLDDPSMLGPPLQMAMLALFYGALVALLLLPVQTALKKQLLSSDASDSRSEPNAKHKVKPSPKSRG